MLASDINNTEFAGAADPDAGVAAQFYIRALPNEFETQKQGRPIFQDVTMVKIFTPGNDKNIVDTLAREDHKARFPRQWAYFQNTQGGDSREVGTPLTQWPLLKPSQVEELRGAKFFTVDAIANASDAQLQALGMCAGMDSFAFRARARAFLQSARDSALPQRQAEELEKLRKEQAEKDEKHDAEMAEMRQMIADLSAKQKGKPGRKPKVVDA